MDTPFAAYRGSDSFVFICYSHQDAKAVYSDLTWLSEQGFNIWFDEGIRPGAEWTNELANAISSCEKLLFFVSERSVQSRHCRDEVQFAARHNKPIIVINLEDIPLPPGLELVLGAIQAVSRVGITPQRYQEKLLETLARDIDPSQVTAEDVVGYAGHHRQSIPQSTPQRVRPRWQLPAIGVATLGFVLGIMYIALRDDHNAGNKVFQANTSVALLPFENKGGFQDDDDYPESIAEDLLNRLVAIEGLRVASRRASFAYHDIGTTSLATVGSALGVSNILTGHIRRSGNLIRLYLELIDVSSGKETVRWSNTYADLGGADLLNVLDEATRLVGTEVSPQGFSSATESRLTSQSTENATAYEAYLRARTILRNPTTGDSMKVAADLLTTAIALDGNFAWAKAGLCTTHTAYYKHSGSYEDAQRSCAQLLGYAQDIFEVRMALGGYYLETGAIEEAIDQLVVANRLNEYSADARILLARTLAQRFYLSQADDDRTRAEDTYVLAIQAEPGYWYSYHAYASHLLFDGRLDEALLQLDKALALEPTSQPSLNNVAGIRYRLGQTSEAEAAWRKSISIGGENRYAHVGLGILYHYERKYDEAVAQFELAVAQTPKDHRVWGRLGESLRMMEGGAEQAEIAFNRAATLAIEERAVNSSDWKTVGFLALYYAYLGRLDEAQENIDVMFTLNPGEDPMTHYWAGLVAFETGEPDEGFAQLKLALDQGFDQQIRFIADEPALLVFQEKYPARFAELLETY